MPMKIKRYGWVPDLPDRRDYIYSAETAVLQTLPRKVDLRPQCPAVYDQGQLGQLYRKQHSGSGRVRFDEGKAKVDLGPVETFHLLQRARD